MERHIYGYTRVSTLDQANEGVSLEMQASKIEAQCLIKDWALEEVIEDAGESAKSLNRPGMDRLIKLIEAGEVSTVIVCKLDRLTRSVSDLDKLIKLFEKHSVALVSLQESLDATTATGRLMMNILSSVSQWEREVIGERTKEALMHLKATGKPYCRGVLEDQSTINLIQEQKDRGYSLNQIAKNLNYFKVKTARGGKWYAKTVSLILER